MHSLRSSKGGGGRRGRRLMFAQKLTFCLHRIITLDADSVKHIQNADICKKLETLHSLRSSKGGGGRRGRRPMFAQKLTFCLDRMSTLEAGSVKHVQNAKICKKLETLHSLRSSKGGGGRRGRRLMFAEKLTFCLDRMITLEAESVKHVQNADICKKRRHCTV